MRETTVLSELRAALRRRGVWGERAERLIQEWTEHVRDDAAHRVERGADPGAARDAAWHALGSPDVLAVSAGRQIAGASWMGRHPWLAGLALPVLAWLAVVAAVLFTPALILHVLPQVVDVARMNPARFLPVLGCWQQAFNWLPWLVSAVWLAWLAVRMPGGWKLFWITAIVLTLFSTSLWMTIMPPSRGPHSGAIYFFPTGPFGMIANFLFRVLGYGAMIGPRVAHPPYLWTWIQTAILLFGAAAFHFKATRTRGAECAPVDG
jgi:hypothetical protein